MHTAGDDGGELARREAAPLFVQQVAARMSRPGQSHHVDPPQAKYGGAVGRRPGE